VTIHRNERVLAYMIVAVIAVAIIDLIGVLIAAAAGAASIWPIFGVLPLIALPLGILLILALTVISARRRSAEARAQLAAQRPTKPKPRSASKN
jgi:cyanate permease